MKTVLWATLLLGSTAVTAAEQSKLEAICETAFAAYNTQDVNLVGPYLQSQLPKEWTAEEQRKGLERWLSEIKERFDRRRARYGDVSYELTEIRFYEKQDIPQGYKKFNPEGYAVLSYKIGGIDKTIGIVGTSCTFLDFTGNGDWQIRTVLW